MGIKEAYKSIDDLERYDYFTYVEGLQDLEAINRCEAYRRAMEIIEKECPEVLEE